MSTVYLAVTPHGCEICHMGVKGMKWGVRKDILFVSGSSKTQDPSSPYYLKKLPVKVRRYLKKSIGKKEDIIVGDAPGIDRQVQDYLSKKKYHNVSIYSPGNKSRYKSDPKWQSHFIDAPEYTEGSPEWLAKKDIVMSQIATKGLAIVLENGGAIATRNNVKRLISANKNVKVIELKSK